MTLKERKRVRIIADKLQLLIDNGCATHQDTYAKILELLKELRK